MSYLVCENKRKGLVLATRTMWRGKSNQSTPCELCCWTNGEDNMYAVICL